MLNLNNHVKYSKTHKEYIRSLGITKYEDWDSGKNINKDISKAYNMALEYTVDRIRNYCNSRNAGYLFVRSDKSVSEILLKTLPEMGVLK